MSVPMVKYEMQVPKDAKEVIDLIDKILQNIVNKTPMNEWTNIMNELIAAVEGMQHVVGGFESDGRDELAGYLVHKVFGTLMPYKATVAEPQILPVPESPIA